MSADFTPEKEDYGVLSPFKMQVLTNFPYIEADFDALTNYGLLCKVVEYLNNVIANENEVTEQVTSLYNAYVALQNYVNTYFDNLDLTGEVSAKLDEMAENGTLTNLIKDYVDPIYQAYETEMNLAFSGLSSTTANRLLAQDVDIANFKGSVNNQIASISSQVQSATSGSPAGTYSTVSDLETADPDHSKIYVVVENGKWYYYNTSTTSWTPGGDYLSSFDENKITNLINISLTNWTDGKYINSAGTEIENASYSITDYIPMFNKGIHLPIYIHTRAFQNLYANVYDIDKRRIDGIQLSTSGSLEDVEMLIQNDNYYYIKFSCASSKKSEAFAYYCSIGKLSVSNIKNNQLEDYIITKEKTSFIKVNPYRDMINKNTITEGYYINDYGIPTSFTDLHITDYIEVIPNETYKYHRLVATYYAYYDKYKNFVVGYSTLGNLPNNAFTVPDNDSIVYMRVTISTGALDDGDYYISKSDTPLPLEYYNNLMPYTYCNYNGKEITTFNKILCIGDSLTQGTFNTNGTPRYINIPKYSYPTYLQKITGVETTNKGYGGSTITSWWENHQNDDLSGHDCCIIALGINDETWDTTVQNNLQNIIDKVISDNPKIPVFVSNIIPALSYQQSYHADINTGITNYINGLNSSQIRLIDINTYGHTLESLAYNAGHLSALGYYRLAQDYANYISFLMTTNPTAYRKIQFVGTNYDY